MDHTFENTAPTLGLTDEEKAPAESASGAAEAFAGPDTKVRDAGEVIFKALVSGDKNKTISAIAAIGALNDVLNELTNGALSAFKASPKEGGVADVVPGSAPGYPANDNKVVNLGY